jgi:hypothetical protein
MIKNLIQPRISNLDAFVPMKINFAAAQSCNFFHTIATLQIDALAEERWRA